MVVFKTETPPEIPSVEYILPASVPTGRVLVLNELTTSLSDGARKIASNKMAELGVAGWELFVDAEKEAMVRTWLPADPTISLIPAGKLANENISGILLVQENKESTPMFYFIDENGALLFQ
jgi:hypothetical protein